MPARRARTGIQLQGATVVITGASSGIGRAAALAFARRGAQVVAAARRDAPLQSLVSECERLGSRALAVPTDVADEAAVDELARRAVEHFGRFDVWVNNAGVYLAGPFEDVPSSDFRRVIEVNLLGYVHSTRAATATIRRQHFREGVRPATSGNLRTPMQEGTGSDGGWTRDGGLLTRSIPDPVESR